MVCQITIAHLGSRSIWTSSPQESLKSHSPFPERTFLFGTVYIPLLTPVFHEVEIFTVERGFDLCNHLRQGQ
jgi:hypothetical protein